MDIHWDKTKVLLAEMTWQECQAALRETDLIIIPVGAQEQHGPHLPLGTDSVHAAMAAEKAAKQCAVLVAPTVSVGVSANHLDFAGTMTLKPQTLIQVLFEYCQSLATHGFRRFVFFNGHGGNSATLDTAVQTLQQCFAGHIFCHVFAGRLKAKGHHCLEDQFRYHADEGETSRMLFKAPHLVQMDRVVDEIPVSRSGLYPFSPEQKATFDGYAGLPRTKEVTKSGVFGAPSLATREKGEALEQSIHEGFCKVVTKIKDVNLETFEG